MKHEISLVSKLKIILASFAGIFLFIFSFVILPYGVDMLFPWIICIGIFVSTLMIQKKIILVNGNSSYSIFSGYTFMGVEFGDYKILNNLDCIFLYRKAGGGTSFSSRSIQTSRSIAVPVNTLQLLNDKEDIIMEIELYDDKESYKIAYWMQSIFKIDISDYMGRELEIIPYSEIS